MMGKRRTGGLTPDSTGQFFRQIGWKLNKAGRRVQPKFRLGRQRAPAELAYHRLGLLWDIVVQKNQELQVARRHPSRVTTVDPGPLWDETSLRIAEAIRKHQHTLKVFPPENVRGATGYVSHVDHLRQIYGQVIQLVAGDEAAAEQGREQHRANAEDRARKARLSARIAEVPVPAGITGTTLYQALDAYAEMARKMNAKESGKVEAGNARRLAHSTPDMDLADFGYTALERVRTYWTSRPEAKLRGGKSAGRRISLTTVDNHLSTTRRFVRWLDRSDNYQWELPRHGLDALKVDLRRLRTDDEMARQRHGVQVFNVEQLTTIYRHATDFERLLVLLALNAAMAQAEIRTLRWDEVEAQAIKRIRRKSGVYGEFHLWPQTRLALDWWTRVRPPTGDLVMTTDRGNAYTRQRISNQWGALRARIEREMGQAPAWWLPFKHLRKTGAQFVREFSDGEIAGVFLSHGQPVLSDDLADVYSNRPFNRVADALTKVNQKLRPVFEGAPDAFSNPSVGRGAHRHRAAEANSPMSLSR